MEGKYEREENKPQKSFIMSNALCKLMMCVLLIWTAGIHIWVRTIEDLLTWWGYWSSSVCRKPTFGRPSDPRCTEYFGKSRNEWGFGVSCERGSVYPGRGT